MGETILSNKTSQKLSLFSVQYFFNGPVEVSCASRACTIALSSVQPCQFMNNLDLYKANTAEQFVVFGFLKWLSKFIVLIVYQFTCCTALIHLSFISFFILSVFCEQCFDNKELNQVVALFVVKHRLNNSTN